MKQGKFAIDKDYRFMSVKMPVELDIDFSCLCKRKKIKKGATIIELIEGFLEASDDC
jgi:hypothetical protein